MVLEYILRIWVLGALEVGHGPLSMIPCFGSPSVPSGEHVQSRSPSLSPKTESNTGSYLGQSSKKGGPNPHVPQEGSRRQPAKRRAQL